MSPYLVVVPRLLVHVGVVLLVHEVAGEPLERQAPRLAQARVRLVALYRKITGPDVWVEIGLCIH